MHNFNEYAVCTNPNIRVMIPHKNHVGNKFEIKTAEKGGVWYWGYFYQYERGGVSYPCGYNYRQGNETEEEAIIEAMRFIISEIERGWEKSPMRAYFVEFCKNYFRKKLEDKQLTLF